MLSEQIGFCDEFAVFMLSEISVCECIGLFCLLYE